MPRVLIVEDEQDLSDLLVYNLKQAQLEVDAAPTGATAMAKLSSFRPDLLVLDLMLPDLSGFEVLRFIRASADYRDCAVIVVTAKGEEHDRIKGLELGADDYVVKPFSVRELVLRVQGALRRRSEPAGDAKKLAAGEISLDAERHEVFVRNELVALTALEFRLLQTLLERAGRVQTREVLLSDVWGIQAEITTRTVDTHIKRLREKLGSAGEIIQTVRGIGYKLSATSDS